MWREGAEHPKVYPGLGNQLRADSKGPASSPARAAKKGL